MNTPDTTMAECISNLEAEVERLRAEVDDLRERLADAGLPSCAREDALEALMEDSAIRYWKHDEETTLTVGVSRDREAEVRQALAAVGAREIGESVSPSGLLVLIFSTAGGDK